MEDPVGIEPEIETGEQVGARAIGDDDLAVGEADVAGQFFAAPGGVDPDDGGAAQRRATQPEEVVGSVVEEHADVERTGTAQTSGQRGAAVALGHHLAPRPRAVLEENAGSVVLGPGPQEVGHRLGGVGWRRRHRLMMSPPPRTEPVVR